LRQVDGFLQILRFLRHDIVELLSKVALNTIQPTNKIDGSQLYI
jgi:hypothetical protein